MKIILNYQLEGNVVVSLDHSCFRGSFMLNEKNIELQF